MTNTSGKLSVGYIKALLGNLAKSVDPRGEMKGVTALECDRILEIMAELEEENRALREMLDK